MIKIKKIRIKNFRSFSNKITEIDLEKNPKIILKGKNGSGKTSIIYAIIYALFDNNLFNKIKVNDLISYYNKGEMFVQLFLEVDGNDLIIRRGRKKQQPFLEIYKNNQLLPIQNKKDMEKYLQEQILKITPEIFQKIFFVNSEIFNKNFLKMTKNEREKFFNKVFGLDEYKDFLLFLKRYKKNLVNKISDQKEKLNILKDEENFLKKDLNKMREREKEIKKIEKELDKNKEKKEKILTKMEKFKLKIDQQLLIEANNIENKYGISFDNKNKLKSLLNKIKEENKIYEQKIKELINKNIEKKEQITSIEEIKEEYTKKKEKALKKIEEYKEQVNFLIEEKRNALMNEKENFLNKCQKEKEDINKQINILEKNIFNFEKEKNILLLKKNNLQKEIELLKKDFCRDFKIVKLSNVSAEQNILLDYFIKKDILIKYQDKFVKTKKKNTENIILGTEFSKDTFDEIKRNLSKIRKDKIKNYKTIIKKYLKAKREIDTKIKEIEDQIKNLKNEISKQREKLENVKSKMSEIFQDKKYKKSFRFPGKEFITFFDVKKYLGTKEIIKAIKDTYNVIVKIEDDFIEEIKYLNNIKEKNKNILSLNIRDIFDEIDKNQKEIDKINKLKMANLEKEKELSLFLNLFDKIKENRKKMENLIKYEKELLEISNLISKYNGIVSSLDFVSKTIEEKEVKLNECKKEKEKITNEIEQKKKELIYLDKIIELMDSKLIRKKIYNTYKEIFNKYLKQYREKFETYEIMIKNNFDLKILKRKSEVNYSNLSKGEETKLNLVVIFALIKMLELLNNIKIDTLIFDEIDGVLDTENLNQVINEINKENKKIIFITHRDDIDIEYTNFKIIEVYKKGFFSQIKLK